MPNEVIAAIAALGLIAVFMAVPMAIAALRRHPERRLIYKLAPLALFSFLLWLALIAWASSRQHDDALIQKYVNKLREGKLLPLVIVVLVVIGAAGSLLMLR
jgi:hypothetical protein